MREDDVQRGEAIGNEADRSGAQFSRYNIIAAYANMGEAKKAIDALQLAGLDAAEMSLLGQTAAAAGEMTGMEETRETDAAIANDVLSSVLRWGVPGAAAGAAVGAILAAFAFWPMGIWTSIAFGFITLGTLGALVGGYSVLNAGPIAELPFRPVGEGHVLVGVLSTDPQRVARAESVLNDTAPLMIHRYDRRGRLSA